MIYQGRKISAFIFDLGDVLINLAIPATIARFAERSGKSLEEVRKVYSESSVFLDYEKGLITDEAFRQGVRIVLETDFDDSEIDDIWNGMLLDFPPGKLELLVELSRDHRLFLLSNTNAIHIRCFSKIFNDVSGNRPIEDFFEKTYYSHLLGMRKPDPGIFLHVLRENALDPAQTLFLDDNLDNIRGAASTGILTHHVTHPSAVYNLFR